MSFALLNERLPHLRKIAESQMTDSCVISRSEQSNGDIDPYTGLPLPGADTTVYTGKCRVVDTVEKARVEEVGNNPVLLSSQQVLIPVDVVAPAVGDLVRITGTHGNRVFTVISVPYKSVQVVQRLQVQAVGDAR